MNTFASTHIFALNNPLTSSSKQPTTKHQHQLIQKTAQRTSTAPQLEVYLKFKQSQNEHFRFLSVHHPLHPYYLFLKRCNGQMSHGDRPRDHASEPRDGLALLAVYDSDDDEDRAQDPPATTDQAHKEHAILDDVGNADGEQRRRAERLQRAKIMRHHFALKITK